MSEPLSEARARWWSECAIGVSLFLATAAVVVWQNRQLGVLWDLSYILENSFRISGGDVPYRDFPFPYAPLTFLVQAALIKLTGRVFWHHILYCAVIGGLGTVLTWRILLNLFRGIVLRSRLVAFLLATPLIVLGIYGVYPHPFYDPDCTFVILLCLFLLQYLERKSFPPLPTFLTGAFLVAPLFVKQNTGLAFLAAMSVMLVMLMVIEAWRHRSRTPVDLAIQPDSALRDRSSRPVRRYLILLAGTIAGLTVALLLIHFSAGLGNYRHWTITFAAQRRTPQLREMLGVYQYRPLLIFIPLFIIGAIMFGCNGKGKRWLTALSITLLSAPFVWPVVYLLRNSDASERAERLVGLWPFVLIMSVVFALFVLRLRKGLALVWPFVLIGVVHGAFLSQQLWGSTYALWPLLILLTANIMLALVESARQRSTAAMAPLAAVISLSLLVAGAFYVRSHERLEYVDFAEGDLVHSTLPQLRGLSMRGSWLPDFEELVHYSEKQIPREDGLLMIPGEDLFYYTTGRRPRFPVLMFDHTVNPFSAEEIVAQARARDIRWLVIKNDLQLQEEPVENKEHLFELLRQDFKHVESLNNYEVFRRKLPGEKEEEPEENDEPDEPDKESP